MLHILIEMTRPYWIPIGIPILIIVGVLYYYFYDEIWTRLGRKHLEEIEDNSDADDEEDDLI